MKCPCTKDCPDRNGTCKLVCQRYKEWEKHHRAELEAVNKRKAAESGFVEHIVRISDRANRRNK